MENTTYTHEQWKLAQEWAETIKGLENAPLTQAAGEIIRALPEPEPEPRVLTTQQDFEDAPDGTVAMLSAEGYVLAAVKNTDGWTVGQTILNDLGMAVMRSPATVLRRGDGK